MNEYLKLLATALILVMLLALGIGCEYQRWNECRRIHPWWYCASNSK